MKGFSRKGAVPLLTLLLVLLSRSAAAQDSSPARSRPSPQSAPLSAPLSVPPPVPESPQSAPASGPASAVPQAPATRAAPRLDPPVLRYPEHKDLVVARIGDEPVRLEQVLSHVENRHAPRLRDFFETPDGFRELNSPLVPLWVRIYCDMRVLREEAAARGLAGAETEQGFEAAMRIGFDAFRERYLEGRQKQGRPVAWTREHDAEFYPRFRREEGLKAEIKALLDVLVPDLFKESEVRNYHAEHGDYFGGEVQISHVMLRHRDPVTGRLWSDEDQGRIKDTLRDIKSRIRPDGINFAAVAQSFSEDLRSGRSGGELGWFGRLDQRLPAVIVREAWRMRDGEWRGPFESPEGMHFVRRMAFSQHTYVLLQGEELSRVRAHLRALKQEDLVFEIRARRKVELRM